MILELKMGVKYVVTALKAENWMPGLLITAWGVASESPQHASSDSGTDVNRLGLLPGV